MNYVDNVRTRAFFIDMEGRRHKPVHTDYSLFNGYDYGYDLYHTLEYGRKYVKNTDFGFKVNLLMKKVR